jgi:hypothetical protein
LTFIILTLAALFAVFFALTYRRFESRPAAKETAARARLSPSAYGAWLWLNIRKMFEGESFKKAKDAMKAWVRAHYPGWTQWIFIVLSVSFLYLVASGFIFALFVPRGLFGLPLLAHVAGGGLFAFSLAGILMWRGRAYRPGEEVEISGDVLACPLFKNPPLALVRKAFFWTFAAFGLIQILTALGSMLPIFSFQTQVAMIVIHRYSALALLLTAIVFIDLTFIPQRRS